MAIERREQWVYESPPEPGQKGVWSVRMVEVDVPERKPYQVSTRGNITTWIIAASLTVLILWLWSMMLSSNDPQGRCQTELGYMGQVEVIECEPN